MPYVNIELEEEREQIKAWQGWKKKDIIPNHVILYFVNDTSEFLEDIAGEAFALMEKSKKNLISTVRHSKSQKEKALHVLEKRDDASKDIFENIMIKNSDVDIRKQAFEIYKQRLHTSEGTL